VPEGTCLVIAVNPPRSERKVSPDYGVTRTEAIHRLVGSNLIQEQADQSRSKGKNLCAPLSHHV